MDNKILSIIQEGNLDTSKLIGNEEVKVLYILNELKGIPYIRGERILKFCEVALKYTEIGEIGHKGDKDE